MVSQITFISLRYQIQDEKISNKNNYKNVTMKRSNPLANQSYLNVNERTLNGYFKQIANSEKLYNCTKKADLAKFRKNDIRKVKKSYS